MTEVTITCIDRTVAPVPPPDHPTARPAEDERESLVNDRPTGTAVRIQIPREMTTSLHAVMLDFDPERLRPSAFGIEQFSSHADVYRLAVGPWLTRHPVFAKAEVRGTGRGVHALLHLDPPATFVTPADRGRWAAAVMLIQRVLPTDPDAPGITALTRPIGSVNGKTGRPVETLKPGVPVTPSEALRLAHDIAYRSFRLAAEMLFPATNPCPICRRPGSRLGVFDRSGRCYGGCGKVTFGNLLDVILRPRPVKEGGRS